MKTPQILVASMLAGRDLRYSRRISGPPGMLVRKPYWQRRRMVEKMPMRRGPESRSKMSVADVAKGSCPSLSLVYAVKSSLEESETRCPLTP